MDNSNWKIPNTKIDIVKLKGFAGVYSYNLKGKPLYIGKSNLVKARLLSHLENSLVDRKEALYVNTADEIELFQTDSELNALLYESKLIQIHRPKYNVRWMDDKSYLYIKITIKEEYPKIFAVRQERDRKALYFGPFASQDVVDTILSSLRKVFPFCTQKKISKHACFHSKIGLCNPCPNIIKSTEEKRRYRKNIRNVVKVLSGNSDVLENQISKLIKEETKTQNYELAMKHRNVLNHLKHIYSHRLFETHENHSFNRSEIMISGLKDILSQYFPKLISLERIECYDVSNLSQQNSTASMVVFTDGQMNKSEYRKFKIGKSNPKGDFEMLKEALERRLKNKWPLPNLMVIDGGKPQIRTMLRLQALSSTLKEIPIIGIAKNPDRLIIGIKDLPTVRLKLNNLALNLLQQMRDEAHRFAIKYHTVLRNKAFITPESSNRPDDQVN